jgi:hypothetical protein
MARADTPIRSLATKASLMLAPSRIFCSRLTARDGIVNLFISPYELSPLRGFFGLFQVDSSLKETEKTSLFPTFQEK